MTTVHRPQEPAPLTDAAVTFARVAKGFVGPDGSPYIAIDGVDLGIRRAVRRATINVADTYDMRFVEAFWKSAPK